MPPLTNTALSIHLSFPVLPQHSYLSPSQHSSLSVSLHPSLCGFGSGVPEGRLFQTGSLINTLPWSLIEAVQVSAVRAVISSLRVANDACDVWSIVSLHDDTSVTEKVVLTIFIHIGFYYVLLLPVSACYC